MIKLGHVSTMPLEVQNGWSALLIGIILLLPFNTFGSSPWYQTFERWAPESTWGVIFLALGIVQLVSTLTDVVIFRRLASALLAILFLVFATGVVSWNVRSIWIGLLVPVVVGQVWAFYQSRKVV